MSKQLRVISINFPFRSPEVVQESTLATEKALFDFDVVVIRPARFDHSSASTAVYQSLKNTMRLKSMELDRLFAQGGVLVLFLDVPDFYTVRTDRYTAGPVYTVNNYEFLQYNFVSCIRSGTGQQISYSDHSEPFVAVLKNSTVAWTAYATK